MTNTSEKPLTMQGVGSPVSAFRQGGKAGPQSSSIDRSFSRIGNLAFEKFNATSSAHKCNGNPDFFCYVCGKFEVEKLRRKISEIINA